MAKKKRDEFSPTIRLKLAKQAGWLCSDPGCRRSTVGSNSDGSGVVDLGIAAHICAAAPGGPRYDPHQSPEERKSIDNGIWLCRLHGTAVDTPDPAYTVDLLRGWKKEAQQDSLRRVLYSNAPAPAPAPAPTLDDVARRLQAATAADLDVYRQSDKWPSTDVALRFVVSGQSESVTAAQLAAALSAFGDLVLVAPPGTGKTTALLQIAEAALQNKVSPIFISLADWSIDRATLWESILKRAPFRGISEDDVRAVAAKPGVVVLLDGWNELDGLARQRLRVELERLVAELPALGIVITTRKQAMDVPIDGVGVRLLPLSDTQQIAIARQLRGEDGASLVDQAWRTPGVRDLVSIPLYLTTLLGLPVGAPFPKTKEEVLRRFVLAHDSNAGRAEALSDVTSGCHTSFLESLAVRATNAANTTIMESDARRAIAATSILLIQDGQLSIAPQPHHVLEVFVGQHVLTHAGEPTGFSFQHQQFQEWYASHAAERAMTAAAQGGAALQKLKAEMLDLPTWEEATLFACERLAHGDPAQQQVCAAAISAAFDVDPMLAAEMIYRSSDQVWAIVAPQILDKVTLWHAPGKVDRALRFMIRSGRSEFLPVVWPLITHADEQVQLAALGAGGVFRTKILGQDAAAKISALLPAVRKILASEIASDGDMDGLALATAIAKSEPDPGVKFEIVTSLAFRRADRHVSEILANADDPTCDRLVAEDWADQLGEAAETPSMRAAIARHIGDGDTPDQRLKRLVEGDVSDANGEAIASIVASIDIPRDQAPELRLIRAALQRYPNHVAKGYLERVRTGRALFRGTDHVLASTGVSVDDDALLEIALAGARPDDRARAAVSALGPQSLAKLIARVLEAEARVVDAQGRYDSAAADYHHQLQDRLAHASGANLVTAIQARAAQASPTEAVSLANLISCHPADQELGDRPFDQAARNGIAALAEEWGARMLQPGAATRIQIEAIASLAKAARAPSLLLLLKRMLDDNITRYTAFREEAAAENWRDSPAVREAQRPLFGEYQGIFLAVDSPDVSAAMYGYLRDPHFGSYAAQILAARWLRENEPSDDRFIDFSSVVKKRHDFTANSASSAEADAILAVCEELLAAETDDGAKKRAVELGIVAARLPHGRRDGLFTRLLALASRESRALLLLNLVLSGETISADLVTQGVGELLAAATTQAWLLSDAEGYRAKYWLRLLPFIDRPGEALAVIRSLPPAQRSPMFLEEAVSGYAFAPDAAAEEVLFALATEDPRFYANARWRDAAFDRKTAPAVRRLIDLTASGAFQRDQSGGWDITRRLGASIAAFPELLPHAKQVLNAHGEVPGRAMLVQALAEGADADCLLAVTEYELARGVRVSSWRSVRSAVTRHVPSQSWQGAYDVVPAPTSELRKRLLALTVDGSLNAAARTLNMVDRLRDDHGSLEGEPRHPDFGSGKPWPILVPDPDATKEG